MSDLSIQFDPRSDAWQFIDDSGATTDFSATSETQPFVANELPSRAANFDVAIMGCSQTASVMVAVLGPSVPITWVPSTGSRTVAVIATCGTTRQSGYVKVKRSGG
ncbi:hypothetical protein ACNOYE_03180 [Nannocystaceae bacterium ST9]